jgi:hypothetical protein
VSNACPRSIGVDVPERGLDTLVDLRVAAVEATLSRVTRRARLTPPLVITNPETGDVTEGQVETIIKAGLQRLTWSAVPVPPTVGWSLRRTGDGIELRDAHGGPWVRCSVSLEPR